AMTFYKFNKPAGAFERLDSLSQDTYLSEDAAVTKGAVHSARVLLSRGSLGELCIGLPVPAAQGPQVLPAYNFDEIVTAKGVYTYNTAKQDYDYKTHVQIAAEIKAATDQKWKEFEEKEYRRRVEAYKLGTERIRALASYYRRRWWWW